MVVVVSQVVLVVEAVSAVVVAHLAVDPVVHPPKDATHLTARTPRATGKTTTATVGSICCLDSLTSIQQSSQHALPPTSYRRQGPQ